MVHHQPPAKRRPPMPTIRKCANCKTHRGRRYCLRTDKHICWKCCNELRVDTKCPSECEYRMKVQISPTIQEIKTDCLAEYHDFLDKHTKVWIAKQSSLFDNEIPLLLKDTTDGRKLLESRLSRQNLDRSVAVWYEKHLGIDLNSKNMSYVRCFEDVAIEFLETIGEGRWESVGKYLYVTQETERLKKVERLQKRKELQQLNYYMVLATGISTDGNSGFSSIELNYDKDLTLVLLKVGHDWLVGTIIFAEINLLYSEKESSKHITYALSKSDFNRAYQLLKQSEAIYYLSPDIQYYWGLYYSLQNKNKEALLAFEESCTLDSTFIEPIYYQALIHYSENRLDIATILFQKALQIDDRHMNSLNFLGVICVQEKKYTQANEYFKQCLQINENDVNALYNLGNLYSQENDHETAKVYYQKCLEIDPDFQLAKERLSR